MYESHFFRNVIVIFYPMMKLLLHFDKMYFYILYGIVQNFNTEICVTFLTFSKNFNTNFLHFLTLKFFNTIF